MNQEKTQKLIKYSVLIYQGQRDGLNCNQFWNNVDGKGNLLMVFRSKSNHIFQAYSPCVWKLCDHGTYGEDITISLFVISQTHNFIYPLKQEYKSYAIHCNKNWGPIFGCDFDLLINGDFTTGFSIFGRAYEFDQYKYGKDDPYLYGQNSQEINECEIYELQFVLIDIFMKKNSQKPIFEFRMLNKKKLNLKIIFKMNLLVRETLYFLFS
ncbi:unnamed protein product [Paramecium octaurelia]|uniref:TLDc domain-containing protein n=1 Tax=Paramecium octaurelia TaxID=43137 RepID=A0A8S1UR76_PAROT|nr:unnamed protein product [Paramecium octaurelia]